MDALSPEQRDAYEAIVGGESIFLTGPGGTGKSHLIGLLAETLPTMGRTLALTAMTGCAAVLLGHGAKTFHSWAGIGLGKDPAEKYIQFITEKAYPLKKRWRSTEVLVIDEISMLTPELLELIDQVAKGVRRNTKPMGGIQVIFVGDFLQLPPVTKSNILKFAFESPYWSTIIQRTIHLKRIFRQNDPIFQTILDEARFGEVSADSLSILKTRCNVSWDKEPIQPTLLFSRNIDVETINNSSLQQLEGEEYTFQIETTSRAGLSQSELERVIDKMDKDQNYARELNLKVGAQVMLIVNLDQDKGLVNGSRGVIMGFDEVLSWPIVMFKNKVTMTIQPHIWVFDNENPVERSQLPLRLAYALTIHKSQGATLDCTLIDIGANTFEYGQAYVALSRVKNLESLYIHQVNAGAFRTHPLVKMFYSGTYQAPEPPVSNIPILPQVESIKRRTPIKGKKAAYGFDDEKPMNQQASLKNYWATTR
jgi:ATP-dependent DNA helicase PIF1